MYASIFNLFGFFQTFVFLRVSSFLPYIDKKRRSARMLPVYNRAVAGMQAAQQELDINANNIANFNTPGFDLSLIHI